MNDIMTLRELTLQLLLVDLLTVSQLIELRVEFKKLIINNLGKN